jgi:hypothetical protein
VKVGIDEPRQNSLPTTSKHLGVRGDEITELPFASDRQDFSGANGDRFGDRTAWVKGKDAPAVEKEVGG